MGRFPNVGSLISLAGIVLQVCALGFVAYVFFSNASRLQGEVSGFPALALLAATGISSVCLGLQVSAWLVLARGAGVNSVSIRDAIWFVGRTEVAKYLPGNAFHYIGRQLFARRFGWHPGAIFAVSLAEVAVVVAAASTVGLVPQLWVKLPSAGWLPEYLVPVVLVTAVLAPLAVLTIVPRATKRLPFCHRIPLRGIRFWSSLTAYFIFLLFVLFGSISLLVLFTFANQPPMGTALLKLVAAFGISYLLGYLTPGAPGGIGIREAMLVLFLGQEFEPAIIAAVAILQRLANIFAELLLFVSTFLIQPPARNPTCQ